MAINIPILTEFADQGIKSARAAFDNFKTSVSQAEGAMGKFKAGTGAALDYVKANAATFAAAGTAAITAFAAKSVTAFQNLALSADRFAAASGLAVEEASRWLEVTADLGVSSASVESAIGKMNRTLGTSPDLFAELGVEIARTDDGATDANQTFLNVIDRLRRIEDPAERAKVATQLLGRGWQEMAVLIETGAGRLNQSLQEVSDAKVIDRGEVQNAKDFRDALDQLKDRAEDFALKLGGALVPVLSDTLNAINAVLDAMGKLGGYFKDVGEGAKTMTTAVGLASYNIDNAIRMALEDAEAVQKQKDMRLEFVDAVLAQTRATEDLTYSEMQQEAATWSLNDAWEALLGTLEVQESFRNAEEAIGRVRDAAIDAFGDPSKFNAYKDAQADVIRNFAQIVSLLQLTNAEQNRIKFLIDTESYDAALEAINRINLARTGAISSTLPRFGGPRAMGGPVDAGTTYLVGENGPELFTPSTSGAITSSTGGGGNITINVTSADPNEVVRALQTYVRQSGPVPVNTRTM